MNRQDIFRRFPLLQPDPSEKYLVIGDDLDSYLSAMLFIRYNPNTKIIGFYEQYSTLFLDPRYPELLPRTIWLDLDIRRTGCFSLGHHILSLSHDHSSISNSACNLNELRGIDHSAFERKYPLGTIHFLAGLYEYSYQPDSDGELLIWLADSSFINGQSHRFRNNVREWLENFLQHSILLESFQSIDTEHFEERMHGFYQRLTSKGFLQGKGQVESRVLRLKGFQFQSPFRDRDYLKIIFSLLSGLTGLPDINDYITFESIISIYTGTRKSTDLSSIDTQESLENFLTEKNVFSYVFVKKNRMNYTANILM